MIFGSNRKQSRAIESNRESTAIDSIRLQSAAIVKSIAIGGVRLLSIAFASSASADIDLSGLQYSTSAASAGRRLELRGEGTVGHALVNGTEYKGDPNGGAATAWNTASLATGWQTLTSGTNAAAILKLDSATTAIEGGRLQSNTTWSNAKTHVIRNWVTVPSGVTLTISQGAIVKFCESAGIKVLSGGKVQINGAEGADVFFASIGNDTYGGDTNLRAGDFETNSYEIVTLNGGTWSDNGYWVTPDAQLRGYPEVTLHDSLASISDGVARIPVTVESTRNAPFSIDWEISGSPFSTTSGTLSWSQSSEGTKYIEIPLKSTYVPSGVETFTVRATLARSVTRANETAQVKVFKGDLDLSALQFSTSAASAGRRLELRDEGTVGHALVSGTEYKGDPNGGAATMWNTASLTTGWQTLTSGTNAAAILKLDSQSTAIEGGRLQSNTTWSNAKTHVVRNWVTVPSGVTLTISQGTIVKFCESAGIKVLSGGKVQINGAEGADVFFASIGNDTYGGDTNMRDGDFEMNSYEIVTLNGGEWSDNGYWVTPDAAVRPYPEVALHGAIGAVEGGVVRVPVSVEGTRNAPFSIDWQITGAPFSTTSGTLTWSQSSEGTKFIEIPIKANYSPNGKESFALSATRARSVNLSNETVRVSVYSGHIAIGDVIENGESTPSAGTEIETRGIGGTMIAKALERITYSPRWNGAASCEVAVDGNRLLSTADEGQTTWPRPETPGLYTFTHKAGGETLTARFAVLGDDTTAIESNRLQSNTTWTADKTWLITGELTVPSGVTLTIEPGAVVKFMPGAKLIVEAGGTCIAKGVKFTHAYDDAVGGDTLFDGAATLPVMEDYEIKGTVTDDDSTEYRYTAPIILSGTITANTTWRGWKVYNVTGNLTVQNGVTLTVEPGTVVKFNSGVSLTVNSGATLNAIGTRAQPIVFTSIKDDEYGGDTNGDGEKTYPYAGDWARIYAGGTLNMNYCRIRYCNNNSDQGAIQGSGGTVLFDNGIIEASTYECVRMNSGKFTAHNSVFRDASMGFGYYGGSGVYVYNCVVADCTIACRASNKHFYNTVFYNCYTFLESTSSSCDHCVFYNEPGLGAQSATQVGSNGNIWGDPKFVDAANGDFRIQKGSPCINAGDAANAPDFDYYGQPRDDGAPDIGIYELAGGMSANDLAAVAVNAQAARSTIGDTLTVSYDVANVGKQAINGSWRDKVSLVSADGGYSIDLGTVVQSAAFAVGATNTFDASFTVPTDAEGTWRVQVGVNVERDIYEGANVTNNVATSEGTVEVSLPARAASDGFSGTATKGAPASAKFALDGAEPIVARINAPAGTVVYLGSGFMPSASSYSARAVVGADGGLIGIPAGVTSAYILVETTSSKGAAFTMTLESAALAVQSVTPTTLPYTGTTGLVIDGANFAEGCTVVAWPDGQPTAEVALGAANMVSATRLSIAIDCNRLQSGTSYTLRVADAGGNRAALPSAVTVANVPAAPKLKATLDAPASVRRGRTLTVYIDYENVGNADLPAPIFELISQGQVFKIDGAVYTNSVKVMGLSAEAPVGTLRPGEPQRIGIPVTILAENVKWKLKSYHAAQEGAKKKLQLEAIYDADWIRQISAVTNTSLYASIKSKMGNTWGTFYRGLGAYADGALSDGTAVVTFRELADGFMAEMYESVKDAMPSNDGMESNTATSMLSTPKSMLLGDSISADDGEWLEGTKYDKDNSNPGDVWWWRGSGWFKPKQDVKTDRFANSKDILLICHGNANSIHQDWIEDMAKKAISSGKFKVVLAADWGDDAFRHQPDWATGWPEETAVHIPEDARMSFVALRNMGVQGTELSVVGHSHGGHYAGIVARNIGAKKLIGLDTSPYWTQKKNPARNKYPIAWNAETSTASESVALYKSSWFYSMGTDPTDGVNGAIWGKPSFYVSQVGDFYNDAWKRGNEKNKMAWRDILRYTDLRHGYSHQWLRLNFNDILAWNWSNSGNTWKELSGYDQSIPEVGQFAGVLRGTEMECGANVKTRVAENIGVSADSVEWLYDRYVLGKDIVSHSSGVPVVRSPASSLPILQERWLRISEHGLNSFAMSGANSSGVYELGGDGVELTMFIENYANNLSVDYNHSTVSRIEKPWQRGFGHLILVADVTDAGSAVSSVVNDVRAAGGASRLSWEKVMRLQNAGLKFAAVNVEGGGMMNEDVFLRPVSGSIRHDYSLPLPASVFPSGKTDDEEPRDAIVLGIVGVNANTWRKNGSIELYEGELCPDNNCIARVIKVKPKGPSGEVMSGRAVEFYWSATQVSAFAPENIQDDNTWTADENGNWTVTLTGATSYGPTNIVAGSWTGFDCTVSQREWTPNPNVTVTGHLFTGEDGDFVPAQDYTVILAVEDANGKIGTKEYQFTIYRHVDEDDGEDEDAGGSTEPKSCDPNAMEGEEGIGDARYVKPGQELTYTIYFENKSDAEAAAACVEVVNPLNEWLDWSSLTMLDVGYNNNVDNGLSGLSEGVSEKTMDGTNVSVRTELTIIPPSAAIGSNRQPSNAVAQWYLRIIDPNGDSEGWPLDMTGGFLPPNGSETHCGEGYIRYKVKVRGDAPGNVVITNSATIIFDHFNDPIETDPAWWNTVAPTSSLITLKPNSTSRGSVSGGGTYKIGATATLKAAAKSGYAFAGWFTDKACTKPLNPKGYDNRSPTVKVVVPEDDTTIYAKFVSKGDDKAALKFTSATKKLATTPAKATAGSKFSLKIGASSLSLPTFSATGLPKGLSINKATGEISGVGTVPGAYTAKVTIMSAAGNKITQNVKITVSAPSWAKGTFYGTAKPGKKGDPMAYLQFTVGTTGKVSGKVTYKGKAYSFKSTLSSCTASKAAFTPKVKIGKKTFKPGTVTVKTRKIGGLSLVEAANSKGTFAAQKKPGLVKKGKTLAKLVGKSFTFTKKTKNSGLTKSGDKLKVKLADGDKVTASGTVNGKKLAALSAPLIVSKVSSLPGMTTYTLYADILDAKTKYYKTVVFTVKVPVVLKPVPKVSAAFAK